MYPPMGRSGVCEPGGLGEDPVCRPLRGAFCGKGRSIGLAPRVAQAGGISAEGMPLLFPPARACGPFADHLFPFRPEGGKIILVEISREGM